MFAGEPLILVACYWPKYEDTSLPATIARFSLIIILHYIILILSFMDCFVFTHLIILRYKFRTLRRYFMNLAIEYENNDKDIEEIKVDKMRNGFIDGIKMHQNLLRYAIFFKYSHCSVIDSSCTRGN